MNLCRSCKRDFGSVAAFDKHRVGKHEHLFSPGHPEGRRCLSEAELPEKGFVRNSLGRWTLAEGLERARNLSRQTPEAA